MNLVLHEKLRSLVVQWCPEFIPLDFNRLFEQYSSKHASISTSHQVSFSTCVYICVCICADSSQNSSDDDTVSSISQEPFRRGRRDSVVSYRDWAVQHLQLHVCLSGWLCCGTFSFTFLLMEKTPIIVWNQLLDVFVIFSLLFPLDWFLLFCLCCSASVSAFFILCVCVCCKQSSDFSDISESAADYFSRSNRRGSIVSDLDDLSIPDLDTVSG